MDANEIFSRLKRPFDPKLLSWRVGATSKDKTTGIALAYIDARDVMQRLDEVCGIGWQCRYTHAEGKTICEIGIRIGGEWLWRAGGAGDTDVEAEKGAISDAFKRAAVLWGIGRYLYSLPNKWVPIKEAGRSFALVSTPPVPAWATPEGFDKGLTPENPNESSKPVTKDEWDRLTEAERVTLQELADMVREALQSDGPKAAIALIDAEDLPPHQKVGLWSRFDAKERSAMKKAKEERMPA